MSRQKLSSAADVYAGQLLGYGDVPKVKVLAVGEVSNDRGEEVVRVQIVHLRDGRPIGKPFWFHLIPWYWNDVTPGASHDPWEE